MHLGPALPHLGYDAIHLLDRTLRCVLVGWPQACAQQLVADENIQRKITITVVIAVEETLRLMAVKRDVGRIQIEHDLDRRRGVRLQEKIRQ